MKINKEGPKLGSDTSQSTGEFDDMGTRPSAESEPRPTNGVTTTFANREL
jgi:hypothetical protein